MGGLNVKKIMYVQKDLNDVIRDIIEYEHAGYIPVEMEIPLPLGIINGSFKLEGGKVIEYPELRPKVVTTEEVEQRLITTETENKDIKTSLTALEETVDMLKNEVATLKANTV
jgi:hypothetical protein